MTLRLPVIIIALIIGYLPAIAYRLFYRDQHRPLIHRLVLWGVPSLFFAYYIIVLGLFKSVQTPAILQLTQWINLCFFAIFIPILFYLLCLSISRLYSRIFKRPKKEISIVGCLLSIFIFCTFVIGGYNRHEYQIRDITIATAELPESFDGYKIAVISDIHIGNLTGAHALMDTVMHIINRNHVDLVCLTGDLLNTKGVEGMEYWPYLQGIKATNGKYGIMGNHDYGDYHHWPSDSDKAENLKQAHNTYAEIGFTLLLDQHTMLNNGTDSIGLIGVENWSKSHFKSYGDLSEASLGIPKVPFNIVLSHDPNLWLAEIINNSTFTLTLSGHTHSAQMVVGKNGWKWSPSSIIFPLWDGLYQRGNQYLFINRGIGYVGLPYRLNAPSEISIITLLHSAKSYSLVKSTTYRLWNNNKILYRCY